MHEYDWKGNLDLVNIVMIGITNKIPLNILERR